MWEKNLKPSTTSKCFQSPNVSGIQATQEPNGFLIVIILMAALDAVGCGTSNGKAGLISVLRKMGTEYR
jgi:hypothetical protein